MARIREYQSFNREYVFMSDMADIEAVLTETLGDTWAHKLLWLNTFGGLLVSFDDDGQYQEVWAAWEGTPTAYTQFELLYRREVK